MPDSDKTRTGIGKFKLNTTEKETNQYNTYNTINLKY